MKIRPSGVDLATVLADFAFFLVSPSFIKAFTEESLSLPSLRC